jgi:hypothetical protein
MNTLHFYQRHVEWNLNIFHGKIVNMGNGRCPNEFLGRLEYIREMVEIDFSFG